MSKEVYDIIKQVMLAKSNRCGICNTVLKQSGIKNKLICLYNNDFSEYTVLKTKLVECSNCFCNSAVKGLSSLKSDDQKYKAYTFLVDFNTFTHKEITRRKEQYFKKCYFFPKNSTPINVDNRNKLLKFFQKYNNTVYVSDLYTIDFNVYPAVDSFEYVPPVHVPLHCPICNTKLKYLKDIFVDDEIDNKIIKAKSCGKHFFINENVGFAPYINDGELKLNYDYFFDISQECSGYSHEPVAVYLQSSLCSKIIIAGYENKSYEHYSVIDYRSRQSRKFLTEVFHEKCTSIIFENQFYSNVSVSDIEPISPFEIELKKDDELANITECQPIEIVLYSPITKIYENTFALYCNRPFHIYMGKKLFKIFVKKYGLPDNCFIGSYGTSVDFSNCKKYSPLTIAGYNVSKKSNLSDSLRHKILVEVINSNKMTKDEVITHLRQNIYLKESDVMYELACQKWRSDITFLENYIPPTTNEKI